MRFLTSRILSDTGKQKQNSRLFYSFGQENIIVCSWLHHRKIGKKTPKPHILREKKNLGRWKELHWPGLKAEQGLGAGATHHMQELALQSWRRQEFCILCGWLDTDPGSIDYERRLLNTFLIVATIDHSKES